MYEEDGVESSGSIVEDTTTTSQVESNPTQEAKATTGKSQKPAEAGMGTAEDSGAVTSTKPRSIPYERFEEVIRERNEAREKALLLDKLQQDPTIAQAFLKNVPREEVDPVIAEADRKIQELGYVRKQDVALMIEQVIAEKEFIREFGNKLNSLSEKYNGSDGKPKFEPEEIVKFMDEYGIKDPEMAYELKYKEELADVRAKAKRGTAFSEKPGQPMQTVGDDDKARLIKEAQETGDWSKVFKLHV